ncbi:MAG: transposase [Verrucomicrobiota bacterium]
MKRSRFREEEIVRIVGEHRGGKTSKEICAEHNISQQTFYN